MNNMLPCHPKDLPKLEDGTIWVFPITVSIVIPIEKLSFFQVATLNYFFNKFFEYNNVSI